MKSVTSEADRSGSERVCCVILLGVIFGFLLSACQDFPQTANDQLIYAFWGWVRFISGSSCLFQIFSPFTLLSAAFHSWQTTCVPQAKKRRRCNALIHNAICLKAFSLDHSLQMNFSEQPQQHHQMEAVFCVLTTSPWARRLHGLETNRHRLTLGLQTRE